MKHFLLAVLCLLGLGKASAEDIMVGGSTRNMIVYAPKSLPASPPLVITLHGANQDAAYQQSNTKWNSVADTAKIVVVYPNAINKFWDTSSVRGSGDMLFITTIIEEMVKRYNIDRTRIYISGFSLGAMMTYNCMEQISDIVAACAPVSGVRFDNRAPKASRQVPFIHTHGTADDVFKWVGDPSHAAGGYPYIPDYVQKWATYYGCTDKTFTQPYPATSTGSKDAMTRWKMPNSNFEVALLQIDGVGHWHSDGRISTTQEIWRFMKRYTLGATPPTVKSISPENNSFDLTQDDRSFTIELSKAADTAKATGKLVAGKKTIKLQASASEDGKTLTFAVPEGTAIPEGECTLDVSGIISPDGCISTGASATYIYGVTEVVDELKIDTLLSPNWPSMKEELGQCIPWGWKLYYYDADDNATTVGSGTSGLSSGCRLMYFPTGGNFTAGFYLSARDKAKSMLVYGRSSDHRLTLSAGKYDLTFRSTYWSTGSKEANASFDVALHALSSTKNTFEQTGITSKGCQQESMARKPTGTAQHKYTLSITTKSMYSLDFIMAQGWSAVLIADVTIVPQLSVPEQYKGTFHRLMLEAEAICSSSDDPALAPLREAVEQYADFASTAPSAYTTAINAMNKAMLCVPTAISATSTVAPAEVRYYSLDGRLLTAPQRGVVIERSADGVRKLLLR